MSNTYKIDYTTDSIHHHRFYNASDESTALSMFLAGAAHKHTDIDHRDEITVTPVPLSTESCNTALGDHDCNCACSED